MIKDLDVGNYILIRTGVQNNIEEKYIIDLENKKVLTKNDFLKGLEKGDAFTKSFFKIEKIDVKILKNKNKQIIFSSLKNEKIEIVLNRKGQIVEYFNKHAKKLDDDFLSESPQITTVLIPNVDEMGVECFYSAYKLKKLDARSLVKMKIGCFCCACKIKIVNLPKLRFADNLCFEKAYSLEELRMPEAEFIGRFSFGTPKLKKLTANKLKQVGRDSFYKLPEGIKKQLQETVEKNSRTK